MWSKWKNQKDAKEARKLLTNLKNDMYFGIRVSIPLQGSMKESALNRAKPIIDLIKKSSNDPEKDLNIVRDFGYY